MTTPLIDQLANAIGSADIGAPWSVDEYPQSFTAERYRKLARAVVAALPASIKENRAGPHCFDVGSVLLFEWGMCGSIEAEVIARTGDNLALNMQRGGSWKHVMSLDDLIKAKAVHISTVIPSMRPRSLISRLRNLLNR
jgi:hypothetical protein